MPIKSVKMKISKNKKMRFFLMSQGSFNPTIRFLGQKVCPVARRQTHRQTHTKVTTVGTLSGLQEFFLQPIINDRPKKNEKDTHIGHMCDCCWLVSVWKYGILWLRMAWEGNTRCRKKHGYQSFFLSWKWLNRETRSLYFFIATMTIAIKQVRLCTHALK